MADYETVKSVSDALMWELGSWLLSQIGTAGLHDAIWDTYAPYSKMDADDQLDFLLAVEREIYG